MSEGTEPKQLKLTSFSMLGLILLTTGFVYVGYIHSSKQIEKKTREARINLRKIADGERAYFEEEHLDAKGRPLERRFISAGPEPSSPNRSPQPGNWDTPEWKALRFRSEVPVRYSYSVVGCPGDPQCNEQEFSSRYGANYPKFFVVRVIGDLDGDGVTSLFEYTCGQNAVTGELEGCDGVYTERETE